MRNKIYTGTSKTLYESSEDYSLILSFEDKIKSLDGSKVIDIPGKGVLNNSISANLMQKLEMIGIENHFIKKLNMRDQLVQFVDIYPIQIHVSTIACGRYVSDFCVEEGLVFESPIIDFRVKNQKLNYPIINESQIISFGWLEKKELADLKNKAIRIHDFLSGLFITAKIRLVDIKLEFGRVFNGEIFSSILVDEISPDNCRLWDLETNEKLCFETGDNTPEFLLKSYNDIMERLRIDIKS